jgi:hypothetical protein
MFTKSEARMSKSETILKIRMLNHSRTFLSFGYSNLFRTSIFGFRIFAARSAPRRFFALVRLGCGGLDSKNGFAVFHQVEPIARDRFQINGIGLEQINFTRLLGEQHLLLVALGFKFVDVIVANLQFLIRRHEQTDDDKPDGKEEKSQKDTIPTLPNGSFTSRPEICVIHFQRTLPP